MSLELNGRAALRMLPCLQAQAAITLRDLLNHRDSLESGSRSQGIALGQVSPGCCPEANDREVFTWVGFRVFYGCGPGFFLK